MNKTKRIKGYLSDYDLALTLYYKTNNQLGQNAHAFALKVLDLEHGNKTEVMTIEKEVDDIDLAAATRLMTEQIKKECK